MSNLNITIGTPVLIAGEHFKVRYRLLPNGSFGAPQNETNAQFTLTGFSDGSYELEVIVVKADGSECPPTYQTFDVVTPFTCIDFTVGLVVETNGLIYLQISYSLPGGFTNPPCGWTIVYNGNVANYAALPASPIKILAPNVTTQVQIIANSCNSNQRACYTGTIPPATVTCIPTFYNSYSILPTSLSTPATPEFLITIHFTQSTPCTTLLYLNCFQGTVFSGAPVNINMMPISVNCAATSFSFVVKPNPNVQWVFDPGSSSEKRKYEFAIGYIDKCGKAVAVGTPPAPSISYLY